MSFLSRLARAFAPLALLFLPASALACTIPLAPDDAAPEYARADDPWIYRGTDIPVDEGWLMGELPNGLRYAVRENGVPPCQISLRVRIDAGSLHELESERGYAHLVEHLTFRESRDFGPGEAIPHFQRLGAQLGSDTNAETSPTHTVYNLTLPDARRDTLEESLRGFAGMIREPALSAANLAADVPIVLAEGRESAGPDRRISDGTRQVLFAGQLLADRSPIGTISALQSATPESVRAFHDRWYRPENTVVVLVGDADVRVLARLIEDHFQDWQGKGPHTPAPDFGQPEAPDDALLTDAVPVGEAGVIVESTAPRLLTYAVMRPWVGVVDNLEYNRGILLDAMATVIINQRLENRARAGGKFLFAQVNREKISRSVDGTFVSFAPLGENWEGALSDVRGVIADALETPPSQTEIDRAVSQFDINYVNMVEQARIQAGRDLADDVTKAVDIREAVAAPETFLSVFRGMQDRFTPDQLFAATQRVFAGEVVRAVMVTPDPMDATASALRREIAKPAIAFADARDAAEAIDFAELPPIGTPQAPFARGPLPNIPGTELVQFENGVRAILFGRDNEPGRVTVRVRFGGGWRAIGDDEAVYAELGQAALVNAGIGTLGQNELDAITAGRKITFDVQIEDGAFVFEGRTRAEDLRDQLYLFAAKLAMPRWDEAPFERAKASARIAYNTYSSDPSGVLNRDLDWLLRDRDPRFITPDPSAIANADAAGFEEVWSRLLAQGPLEVAVFGDIDYNTTVAMLSETFGALPPRDALPVSTITRGLAFPSANEQPLRLTHGGDANQAAAVIAWPTGGGSDRITRGRKLELLSDILSNRLIDQLRETAGAAYSPFVSSNWPQDVQSGGMLLALVQIEPELLPIFFQETDRIVRDLALNGPSADELARVVEPKRQYIMRAGTGHTFWLNQLQGAAFDMNRVAYLRSLFNDYAATTPEELRSLAEQYLLGHGGYRIAVLPEEGAQSGETQPIGR